MKVFCAAQVFSHSLAAEMDLLARTSKSNILFLHTHTNFKFCLLEMQWVQMENNSARQQEKQLKC
jgi:hypothetical protein